MRFHFLKTPNLPSKPDDVVEVENYGHIVIRVNGDPLDLVGGDHTVWEGSEEALGRWVDQLVAGGLTFWLGEGAPIEQKFVRLDYSKAAA